MGRPSVTGHTARRRPALALAGLFFFAFLVAALLSAPSVEAGGTAALASVGVDRAVLRQSARNAARAVATVQRNDIVRVLSQSGAWREVATSGGQRGWCPARFLHEITDTALAPGDASLLDCPSDFIDVNGQLTYAQCREDMAEIAKAYGSLARIETVGASVFGNPIEAVVIGNPEASTRILVHAAMHAREHITALVALRQAECLLKAASLRAAYRGVPVSDLLEDVEIWVVPVANPDGMRLVQEGMASVPEEMPAAAEALRAMNGNSQNFSQWKANGRGVDLNRNFDAGWGMDPKNAEPGPLRYVGQAPCSEPESAALRDLALERNFALSLGYHTAGEVLYWHSPFEALCSPGLHLAKRVSLLTGYAPLPESFQGFSGGFRDWFVSRFRRPGLTVEVGKGDSPLPQGKFHEYWRDTRYVLADMAWAACPR